MADQDELLRDHTPEPIWSAYAERLASAEAAQPSAFWQVYGDARLQSFIGVALENNNDLEVTRLRVREARALRRERLSDYGLSISGDLTAQRQRLSQTGGLPADIVPGLEANRNLYEAGFDARWEVDIFGRKAVEKATQAATIRSRLAAVDHMAISLVAEISRSYIDCQAATSELALLASMISVQERLLAIEQKRFEVGESNQLALQASKIELNTLRGEHANLKIEQHDALVRLRVLEGGGNTFSSCGEIRDSVGVSTPRSVSSEALLNRPDVLQAEQTVVMRAGDLRLTQLDVFPSFQLLGGVGTNTTQVTDFFDPNSVTAELGGLIEWSLFDGGRQAASIDQATSRLKIAQKEYAQTVLLAIEEVEQSAVRAATSQYEVQRLAGLKQLYQDDLEIRRARFHLGEAALDEQLQAELSFQRAERRYTRALKDLLVARISLDKALGASYHPFPPIMVAKTDRALNSLSAE